jgi:tyrosine-protein kinase Etk/Wzc
MLSHTNQPLRPSPARRDMVPSLPPAPEAQAAADAGEFRTYFNVLVANRWLILCMACTVGVLGFLYALSVKSVYEANMTFQVEETSPNASKNVLSEASSLYESKSVTVAEMELLRSRMVLTPVVGALRLDIDVQPVYFPVGGAALARIRSNVLPQSGLSGMGGYAWGGEELDLAAFDVAGPLRQRTFIVTATGRTTYRLSDEKGSFAWDGRVGVPLRGQIDGARAVMHVATLRAAPGTRFKVRTVSAQAAIARIQGGLRIAEQGKQSGVVDVRLEGNNPVLVHAVLREMAREYLRQAVARKREDAEKSLAFIDAQLIPLRTQLVRAEALYAQFQYRHGTVNLADETRVGVEHAAAAKARHAELLQKRADMASKFTDQHPVMIGINNQLREMERAARAGAQDINALAAIEQDEMSLSRDIKAKSELYNALTTTAQQLRILVASQSSNVRLIDAPAVPEAPVKPNRPLIVSGAVMAGLLLGVLMGFVRRAVFAGIDGPETVEKLLGTKVMHVSIPHSSFQRHLCRQAERGERQIPMLARVAPEDPAIEALRAFRAALQYALPRFRNNIVMLTGPSAGLGKSFLSANGATVIAASGKRVLLIDADTRDGQLHRYFGNDDTPGLRDVLCGAVPVAKAIRYAVSTNLDFMSPGSAPSHASDLLTNANCAALLAAVSERYDLVLIDAPRVLGVADALILGAHAGAVFLLVRAGVTTADELTEAIMRLNQAGIVPEGILFNDLRKRRGLPDYQSRAIPARQIAQADG